MLWLCTGYCRLNVGSWFSHIGFLQLPLDGIRPHIYEGEARSLHGLGHNLPHEDAVLQSTDELIPEDLFI
ncbi:hypothetical protein ACOMHN_021010 [Nucella lapillus]